MIVGVPRESFPGELRVALTPAVVPNLTKAGIEVVLEAGAGVGAGYPDAEYVAKGAKLVPQRADVFRTADIIVQVLCYGSNDKSGKGDLALLRRDQALIGFLRPLGSLETVARDCRHRRDFIFCGIDASNNPRAKHGRAFLHGHNMRLQSGPDRR